MESAGNVVAAVVAESLMVEELAVELVIEDVVVTVVAEVSMALCKCCSIQSHTQVLQA